MIKLKTTSIIWAVLFTVANAAESETDKPHKVVCYLGSWANYRNGEGKFVIEDIDPFLCTHLIYGFAKLQNNKIAAYDTYLDLKENWGLGAFDRFNNLKEKNPKLKTLIAIGGWNEGSTKYSQMASSPSNRRTFIESCVLFLQKHKFDGLDLDWEYPANRGGRPEDKANFVNLIKELKEAFQPHGFLLTAAVGAGQSTVDSAYDVQEIGKYLDFINLMTYDFHGSWDKTTGHNAPLYAKPNETDSQKKLNVDYAVKYWISKGAPAEKLILGMALYGRGFSLQDTQNTGIDATVNGPGMSGEFTNQPGMLGYNEICKILLKDNTWKITFESSVEAPYAVKGREWIGYDNIKSIALKVQYIRKMHLGGGMVWSIETDDFRGKCHSKKYALLRTINEALNSETSDPTEEKSSTTPKIITASPASGTTQNIATKAPPLQTTQEPVVVNVLPCPYSGYFRHPKDCKIFYFCQPRSPATKENLYYMFRCSEGTVFSQALRVCVFPYAESGCN